MINSRLFDWHGIDTHKDLGLKTFCPRPYDTVLIDKQGSCYLCECTSWLPQSVGNLHIQPLENILNSNVANELRNSIADGSYRYCNTKQCSYFLAKGTQHLHFRKTLPDRQVKNIRLAIDDSCNLSCPSCRTRQIFERDKFQLRKKYNLADRIIEYVRSQKHEINIHVGSDGDPFASLIYRYFIKKTKELSNVRLTIQTNGLLIKKMYHRHKDVFDKLNILNISIDGASKETYELLRRGGSYEKIIENLQFLKTLNRKFMIRMHMVVQEKNFREMLDFIELAKENNIDRVIFNRMENWNTDIDFDKENIFSKDHLMHGDVEKIINKIMLIRKDYPEKFIEGTAIPY